MAKPFRLKTEEDIKRVRAACEIINDIFRRLGSFDFEGLSADELDSFIESCILKKRGRPAFKTVKGYGYASCISVNSEAAHGIPTKKKLFKNGDIIKIDIGVSLNGYFGDSCFAFTAGSPGPEVQKVRRTAYSCLKAAIEQVRDGSTAGDVGHAIHSTASAADCSVVTAFSGHGVGFALHEPPRIPNRGAKNTGVRLRKGMVLALEPMVNLGGPEVRITKDGWTALSTDGSLSAQFEHTVAVTGSGCDVLTDFSYLTEGLE